MERGRWRAVETLVFCCFFQERARRTRNCRFARFGFEKEPAYCTRIFHADRDLQRSLHPQDFTLGPDLMKTNILSKKYNMIHFDIIVVKLFEQLMINFYVKK